MRVVFTRQQASENANARKVISSAQKLDSFKRQYKPNPPHHIREVKFAQISLVLSVERQKFDFKN
jgi:hypothetical protein